MNNKCLLLLLFYGLFPSCSEDQDPQQHIEIANCNDGIDNDGDGLTDWQYDLGCAHEQDDEQADVRANEFGFTTFDASTDTLIIYISSSSGDDANDGLSPMNAVATIARGAELVRDGHHDFMLLKRGDTWRGEHLGRFKSGYDENHPLLISSYGDSKILPRVEVNDFFINHNGRERNFVAVVGLQIVSYPKIPDDPEFDGSASGGFRYVGGGHDLLIEGCHLLYNELVVQTYGDYHYEDVEIRRNIIELNYHVGTCGQNATYRPSGMYASHVTNLTIEENVFDHNGWNEDVSSACATMYNHNMYLNGVGLKIKGNIIARASSMGIKMRSDATTDAEDIVIEGNIFVDGEIGLGIGGNTSEPHRFSHVSIHNNVFTQIGLGNPTERNFSWMLDVADNIDTDISGNYFLHQTWYNNAYGVLLGSDSQSQISIHENVFYNLQQRSLYVRVGDNWNTISIFDNSFLDPGLESCLVEHQGSFQDISYMGNHYHSTTGEAWFCVDGDRLTPSQWEATSGESNMNTVSLSYTDPDRTVARYAASLGLDESLEAFLEEARKQQRLNWRSDYTTEAVFNYIVDGLQ